MRRILALVFLAGPPVLAQQASAICQSDFDTPVFDPAVSMGGPNLLLAIQLTAAATFPVSRLEVFTGRATGSNTLSIWSHDAVTNQPLAPIAQGSWQMSRIVGWQGANVSPTALLAQGQTFWFVWGAVNGAQASVQGNGPGAQPYRGTFTGGAPWGGPYVDRQWKLRIWCGAQFVVSNAGAGTVGM
jgi:hypothetical protein